MCHAEAADQIVGPRPRQAVYLQPDRRSGRPAPVQRRKRREHFAVLHDAEPVRRLVDMGLAGIWRRQRPGGGCIIR